MMFLSYIISAFVCKENSIELNRPASSLSLQPWHSCHKLIYVRPNPKTGVPVGHWPVPESFWPDQNSPTLVSRENLENDVKKCIYMTVNKHNSQLSLIQYSSTVHCVSIDVSLSSCHLFYLKSAGFDLKAIESSVKICKLY